MKQIGTNREAMKSFRNLPIQQKMLVMTLFICGVVLVVATAALFLFQVVIFRSDFLRDNSTLAEIIANNSAGAVAFRDDAAATEVVDSLAAKPAVLSACAGFTGWFLPRALSENQRPRQRSHNFPPRVRAVLPTVACC